MAEGEAAPRGPYVGSRRLWLVVGGLAITLWIWGASGSVCLMLHDWGHLPEALRPMTRPRGPFAISQFWALLTASWATITFFALRRSRRWTTVPLAVIAPLVVWGGLSHLPGHSVQSHFDVLRPELDRVAALPLVTDNPHPDYYEDLPDELAYVAVYGLISTDGRGAVFVPQWAGIPDDAGGFIYWPYDGEPRWDMWGMACSAPVHLDGMWWGCGLADAW